MADVGTDHGLLPLFLLNSGRTHRVYALDRSEAALRGATARAQALGWTAERGFVARVANGLPRALLGEIGTAVFAGLGGGLVTTLLDAISLGPEQRGALRRLVVQPNRDAPRVRAWAQARGWTLEEEALVAEGRHLYPVLTLRPLAAGEQTPTWDAADFAFGPLLRRRASSELRLSLLQQENALREALAAAGAARAPAAACALTERLELVTRERSRIENGGS